MPVFDLPKSGIFLYHRPCLNCKSSDALAVYDDGHGFCFSCETYFTKDQLSDQREGKIRIEKSVRMLYPTGKYFYLPKRKLNADTLQKYGYSVTVDENKEPIQIAPYYDEGGTLVAQKVRKKGKIFYWVGNPRNIQLFGQQLFRGGGKMLIITEGEIDCLTVSQLQDNKYPVVSIYNGATGAKKAVLDNIEFVESYEKVIIMFDNDDAGAKAAQEVAALLSPGKAFIAHLPLKDPNEMLVMGKTRELMAAIWEAKPYRPDGIISGSDLWNDLLKGPDIGYLTPYPILNNVIKGVRKGELYLFTAGSGIGKSTLVNEIGYEFLVNQGLSIGVIALEENKKRTAERYIGMYLNKPIHFDREGLKEKELKKAFDEVLNNNRFWLYDHFGSTSLDNLISKLRYMITCLSVDFIILDHISIVVSGLDEIDESERKTIDKLMTKIRSLIEETGVGILAIVHLKRPDKGKTYNEGRQINLTDLRGSGALEQLSDVVIALERDQTNEEEKNISHIRVLKNRPIGLIGECDTLEYNHATGRLFAVDVFENNVPLTSKKKGEKKKDDFSALGF